VIVSDVKGMTEFIEEGKNGFIFSRGSTNNLTRVLKMIVTDPEKARSISQTTEYLRTTRMMTEEVVAVYNTVLTSK
jgi:glycosyltransferase involved in cell wall biosynthesis